MVWSLSLGSVGKIGANIALESLHQISALFGMGSLPGKYHAEVRHLSHA